MSHLPKVQLDPQTSMRSEFKFPYVPALDGLRGVAIIAVMLFHANSALLPGGHLGVDVFFGLSGFLISILLIKEWNNTGRICFRGFYTRRALRLIPAFYLLLAVAAIHIYITEPKPLTGGSWAPILLSATYLSNWARAFGFAEWTGALGHTWSLSIEEQFYLIWPGTLWALLRCSIPAKRIIAILGLGMVLVAALRLGLWQQELPYWDRVYRLYNGLDTRLDALLAGSLVAILVAHNLTPKSRQSRRILRAGAAVATVLLVAFMARLDWHSPRLFIGGLTLSAACTSTIILALLCGEADWLRKVLELKPLVWAGRISYGLYLWHAPVFHLMKDMPLPAPALELLRWSLSVIAALVSFRLVEQPFLAMKARFAPDKPFLVNDKMPSVGTPEPVPLPHQSAHPLPEHLNA